LYRLLFRRIFQSTLCVGVSNAYFKGFVPPGSLSQGQTKGFCVPVNCYACPAVTITHVLSNIEGERTEERGKYYHPPPAPPLKGGELKSIPRSRTLSLACPEHVACPEPAEGKGARRRGLWIRAVLLLIIVAGFPKSALAVTKVVYPVNGTAVKTATITVLGVTSTPDKAVTFSLNGTNVVVKVDSDGVFAQSLRLNKLWNVLQVDGRQIKVFFAYGGKALPENATEAYPHPAAMEGCTDCHGFDGEGGVEIAEEGKELCLMCHDDPTLGKNGTPLALIHSPISDDDDCTSCHDPHQGENRALNVEPLPELCYQCHDSVTEKKKGKQFAQIHGPVNEGYCTQCHDPHASSYKALLPQKGSRVCFECHDDPSLDSGGKITRRLRRIVPTVIHPMLQTTKITLQMRFSSCVQAATMNTRLTALMRLII